MDRRNFFKNLGTATVGVIVAPVVIMKAAENISKPKREGYMNVKWPDGVLGFDVKKIDERIAVICDEHMRILYKKYGKGMSMGGLLNKIGRSR